MVISTIKYNLWVGLALICPITSKAKSYSLEVAIPEGIEI